MPPFFHLFLTHGTLNSLSTKYSFISHPLSSWTLMILIKYIVRYQDKFRENCVSMLGLWSLVVSARLPCYNWSHSSPHQSISLTTLSTQTQPAATSLLLHYSSMTNAKKFLFNKFGGTGCILCKDKNHV